MRRVLMRGAWAALVLAGSLGVAPAVAKQPASVKTMTPVEHLIAELGRPDLDMEQKQAVKRTIADRGKAAIPVLIAHLGDKAIYEKHRDVRNYYGLPLFGPRPSPVYADITVGSQCREILYEIITPRYRSPYEKPIKPYSWSMLAVHDWPAWWLKNQAKSLDQIHEELKPLVDKYWQQHGTEQIVQP